MRRALGADRVRIIRQLLTESLLLSLIGGALGTIVGVWGVAALKAIAPPGTPRMATVSVDRTVLMLPAVLSLATGVLFGLIPAVARCTRSVRASDSRPAAAASVETASGRARRILIVARDCPRARAARRRGTIHSDVRRAAACRARLQSGQRADRFVIPPPVVYKGDARQRAFYDAVLERASALPGVTQAALSSVIPLERGQRRRPFRSRDVLRPRTVRTRRSPGIATSRRTISRPWGFRCTADGCSRPAT